MNQSRILLASVGAAMAMMAGQRPLARPMRAAVCDNMMTFDGAQPVMDSLFGGAHAGAPIPIHPGRPLCYGAGYSRGGIQTHDGRTADSTGVFFVGELERLDPTMHEPLFDTTWARDIDLREDVTMADDVSSFTLTTYGSQSGAGTGNGIGNGKAWAGRNANQITGVGVDIAKIPHPLTIWAQELKYSIPEIESSAKAGRPIDQQKFAGMQIKYQMDVDEQVNFGDTPTGATGLVNAALVTNKSNLPQGASGSALWAQKTPDEILADFNTALQSVWAASAWAVPPEEVRVAPAEFGLLTKPLVIGGAGAATSILNYVMENNITTTRSGKKLRILPSKWCIGAGTGGTTGTANGFNRMVVYTKRKDFVRFPMTMLQRTPVQYDSIYHKATYYCKLGQLEVVRPDTVGYFDLTG